MSITDVEVAVPAGRAGRAPAGVVGSRLQAVAHELASLVASFDADDLDGSEAARVTGLFADVERLAMAGKTLAAGRVAETGYARALGFDTAGRWLSHRTKATPSEAARTIETSRHLSGGELEATRDALVGGKLTATQAHEIATAAVRAPGEQDRLLALAARETTNRLKDECRQVRLARKRGEDPKVRGQRIKDEMRFAHRDLGGGLSELSARMPTSWLARVLAAVNAQCDAVFARARAEGRRDPHQVYLVEALVTLLLFGNLANLDAAGDDSGGGDERDDDSAPAAADTDHGAASSDSDERDNDSAPTTGHAPAGADRDDGIGDATGGSDRCAVGDDALYAELLSAIRGGPAPPRPSRRQRRSNRRGKCSCGGRVTPRAKIIVRTDLSALLRGHATTGEVCEIAGVGPVPVATVRELWPDAVVKAIITRGVDVLNVTTLGRRAIEAMETAMQFTAGRCTNIACDNERFVQTDHRLGYANVHRTRLDELDPLCTCCHGLKTNDNWQLARGTGRRQFVPPEHPDHPGDPPTPRWRPTQRGDTAA
jgi:hypothetical protein